MMQRCRTILRTGAPGLVLLVGLGLPVGGQAFVTGGAQGELGVTSSATTTGAQVRGAQLFGIDLIAFNRGTVGPPAPANAGISTQPSSIRMTAPPEFGDVLLGLDGEDEEF
jgi:hypothetical protein